MAETAKKHEDRGHSLLGGSKAHIYVNCYGSVSLYQDLPENDPTPAAISGTKTHTLAEELLTKFLHEKVHGPDAAPKKKRGRPKKTPNFDNLPTEERERYERAQGYVDAIWNHALQKSVTDKGYGIEEDFVLHEGFDMYGHIDFWAAYIDRKGRRAGVVVDLKDGNTEVIEKDNLQLIFYALCLYIFFKENKKPLEYVRTAIYQARAEEEENRYKETWYTAKQLEAYYRKFLKAAEEILVKKSLKFKTGDHCRYCPGKAVCVTYIEEQEKKTSLRIVDAGTVAFPKPETLDPERLAKIVLHSKEIENYLKACRAYVFSRHQTGNKIPGVKVIAVPGRRKWIKDEDTIVDALEAAGVDPYRKTLKPLTAVEKELEDKSIMAELVEKGATVSIVSEDDPRPEAQDFTKLLEEE